MKGRASKSRLAHHSVRLHFGLCNLSTLQVSVRPIWTRPGLSTAETLDYLVAL